RRWSADLRCTTAAATRRLGRRAGKELDARWAWPRASDTWRGQAVRLAAASLRPRPTRSVRRTETLMEHGDTVDTSGLSRALAAFHNRNVGVTDILAVAGSGLCLAATTRRQQDEVDRLAANLFMLDALT